MSKNSYKDIDFSGGSPVFATQPIQPQPKSEYKDIDFGPTPEFFQPFAPGIFDNIPKTTEQPVSQQEVLDKQDEVTSKTLLGDSRWINAAKQIYKNDEGKEFRGPDSAVAKWLLNRTAAFEYDLTNTIKTASQADSFDDATKKAWGDAIDLYGELPISLGGTGRFIKHMLTDPTFVIPTALTLGAGGIARQFGAEGVKAAAKFSLKEALKKAQAEGLKGAAARKAAAKTVARNQGTLFAVEGGLYGGAADIARQDTLVDIGKQDDISFLQAALSTGFGAALGGGAAFGGVKLSEYLGRTTAKEAAKKVNKIFDDIEELDLVKQEQKTRKQAGPVTNAVAEEVSLRSNINPVKSILSYGSGKVDDKTGKITEIEQIKSKAPVEKVDAFDLEGNMVDLTARKYKEQYNPDALFNQYDIVHAQDIASSLKNSKGKNAKLGRIIQQLANSTKDDGSTFINTNQFIKGSAGKKASTTMLKRQLRENFEDVSEEIPGVFKASKPKRKTVKIETPEGTKTFKEKLLYVKDSLMSPRGTLQKYFSNDAGLGDDIGKAYRDKVAAGKRTQRTITNNVAKLEKALKKSYGSVNNVGPRITEQINQGLAGKNWNVKDLDDNLINTVNELRQSIDDLQNDLLDSGAVSGDLKSKIELSRSKDSQGKPLENMAFYLNRSYEFFDNPKYKASPESLQNAFDFFKNQFSETDKRYGNILDKKNLKKQLTDAELKIIYENPNTGKISGVINSILKTSGNDVDVFEHLSQSIDNVINNNKGARDSYKKALKTLTQKKTIDPVIKALLGESTDPINNYTKTMSKLGQIMDQHNFAKSIRLAAEDPSLNVPIKISTSPVGKFAQEISEIDTLKAPDVSGLDNPLKGLYTTQEFAEMLAHGNEISPYQGGVYKNFLIAKAATQIAKTAYSPVSIARNFLGSSLLALANGYTSPRAIIQAKKAFRAIGDAPKTDVEKEIQKGIKLGYLDSDARAQAFIELSKDIDFDNYFARGELGKKFSKKFGKLNDKTLKTYQSMDNFWKWFGFLNEKNRQQQILIDKGLNPNEVVETFRVGGEQVPITRLDIAASDMIRQNMHNYGETAKGVKMARRLIFGDFIAFKTEMIRSSKNILKNGIKDYFEGARQMRLGEQATDALGRPTNKLKGQAQRDAGARRLAGFTAATAGSSGLTYGSAELSGLNDYVFGTDITKKQAIEYFDPDYAKGNEYVYLGDVKDGKGLRLNFGYIDPFTLFKAPLANVLDNFTTEENALRALDNSYKDVTQKFLNNFGFSMLTQALIEAGTGIGEKGEELSAAQRAGAIIDAFVPGVYNTAEKLAQASVYERDKYGFEKPLDREIFNLTGLSIQEYDINKSLPFMTNRIARDMNSAGAEYNKLFKDYRGTSPNKFLEYYNDSQEIKYRAAQDLFQVINRARELGLNDNQIMRAVTKKGLFKKNYSPDFIRAMVKKGLFKADKPITNNLRKWSILTKQQETLKPIKDNLFRIYSGYNNKPLDVYKKEKE
jgi:phage baseplate assembly protein W